MKLSKKLAAVLLSTISVNMGFLNTALAEDEVNTFSKTYMGDLGEECSVSVANSEIIIKKEKEFLGGIGLSILAPVLSNVISGSIDSLGSSITSAAQEDKTGKTVTTTPGSGYLSTLNLSVEDLKEPTAQSQGFCIRVLIAKVKRGEIAKLQEPNWTSSNNDTLKNAVTWAIKEFHEETLNIDEINFYAEYLVGQVNSPLSGHIYKIEPVILWYPNAINGKKYELASTTLSFLPTPTPANNTPILEYSRTFEPNGLTSGTYLNANLDGLTGSPWMSINLVDAESKTEIDKLNALILAQKTASTELKTLNRTSDLSQPGQPLARYANLSSNDEKVLRDDLEFKKLTCDQTARADKDESKKNDKLIICQRTFENAIFKLDKSTTLKADRDRELARINAEQKVTNATKAVLDFKDKLKERTNLSPINVSATIRETRDARKFYAILGKAITDSKSERDAAISSYVNGQLGITPDPDTPDLIIETGAYLLAKQRYDIALRDYEAALIIGDQTMIDLKLTDLITAYTSLLSSAKAANVSITLPSPY